MTERTRKAGGAGPRFTVLLSLIFASQLRRAREHGITWATAAGNEANVHWQPGFPVRSVFASEDFDPSRVGEVVRDHFLIRIRKEDEDAPATRFDMPISCPGMT